MCVYLCACVFGCLRVCVCVSQVFIGEQDCVCLCELGRDGVMEDIQYIFICGPVIVGQWMCIFCVFLHFCVFCVCVYLSRHAPLLAFISTSICIATCVCVSSLCGHCPVFLMQTLNGVQCSAFIFSSLSPFPFSSCVSERDFQLSLQWHRNWHAAEHCGTV